MSTVTTPLGGAPGRLLRSAGNVASKPLDVLDDLGGQLSFYGRSLGWSVKTVRRYKKEVIRLLAEVSLGSGGLALIGGTVGVITFICFFTGTEVGLEGYQALDQLGSSAFSGFISAYFNTREIAPLVAGLALAATVGCGFTAQLGAMRVSEEVDALEVMGVPSVPYRDHSHHRRSDRGRAALLHRPDDQLFRDPHDRDDGVRAVDRYVRPLLPSFPAPR
jgi:ABC-type transporter Mla maintaining outer membrane lipid asymmetry permease subunit MlaE